MSENTPSITINNVYINTSNLINVSNSSDSTNMNDTSNTSNTNTNTNTNTNIDTNTNTNTSWNIHLESARKKRKNLTDQHLELLIQHFECNPKPSRQTRKDLAQRIPGMTERSIQIWFQNRRTKLNLTNKRSRSASDIYQNEIASPPSSPNNSSSSSSKSRSLQNLNEDASPIFQSQDDVNSVNMKEKEEEEEVERKGEKEKEKRKHESENQKEKEKEKGKVVRDQNKFSSNYLSIDSVSLSSLKIQNIKSRSDSLPLLYNEMLQGQSVSKIKHSNLQSNSIVKIDLDTSRNKNEETNQKQSNVMSIHFLTQSN